MRKDGSGPNLSGVPSNRPNRKTPKAQSEAHRHPFNRQGRINGTRATVVGLHRASRPATKTAQGSRNAVVAGTAPVSTLTSGDENPGAR